MRQTITREQDLDCGSNSCRFGGLGKGGMRTNGRCQCVQHLIEKANSYAALLEALKEILEYNGGADSALDDPYVMERAQQAIAQAEGGA